MKANRFVIPAAAVAMMLAAAVFAMTLTSSMPVIQAHSGAVGSGNIKHVLLLSIDGMHAVAATVATRQVAPTIVEALGLNPSALDAVRTEGTPALPEVIGRLAK